MQRGPRFAIAAVLLTLAAPLAHAPGGDAGSGGDASGDPAAPTPLPSWGMYGGNFASGADADWYAAPTTYSGPGCLVAQVASSTWANVTLATLAHSVTGAVPGGYSSISRISIASLARSDEIGLAPTSNPNTGANPGGGSYGFALSFTRASDLGPGDGGTGGDAGATSAQAVPVSGPCVAGSLSPLSGDVSDVYAVNGTAGQQLVISIADDANAVGATLTDAAGDALATISPGGLAAYLLPTSGTYFVTMTSMGSSSSTYSLALVGGDPTTPCRPYCSST